MRVNNMFKSQKMRCEGSEIQKILLLHGGIPLRNTSPSGWKGQCLLETRIQCLPHDYQSIQGY